VSLLGNTVFLAGDGAGAVSAVSVAILVLVAAGDSLAPFGAALEVDVVDVGTGVNDVDVDTLTTFAVVQVLVEAAE
jgi:hypothetical protein